MFAGAAGGGRVPSRSHERARFISRLAFPTGSPGGPGGAGAAGGRQRFASDRAWGRIGRGALGEARRARGMPCSPRSSLRARVGRGPQRHSRPRVRPRLPSGRRATTPADSPRLFHGGASLRRPGPAPGPHRQRELLRHVAAAALSLHPAWPRPRMRTAGGRVGSGPRRQPRGPGRSSNEQLRVPRPRRRARPGRPEVRTEETRT